LMVSVSFFEKVSIYDTDQFFGVAGIELQISYTTIRDFTS